MDLLAEAQPQASTRSGSSWLPHLILVGVIVVYAFMATVISLNTPAWEASDEPAHVQNIETLVSGHWYGMNSACHETLHGFKDCSSTEAHQAPLYYLVMAGWQTVVGHPRRTPAPGPASFRQLDKGIYVHHSDADLRFLLWLRLPNIVFGALTILFTYLGVRTISEDAWTPIVAASIVAFLPRLVFLTAFVTNDNLVDLLGAILLWAAVRYFVSPTPWRLVLTGGVVGLLVCTKLSTLPVVLVLFVLPLLRPERRSRLLTLVTGLGTALLVSSWYLIQNTVRYGDPLARRATVRYLEQVRGLGFVPDYRVTHPLNLILGGVPAQIYRGFWYTSGWNQFRWHWPANLLFWIVLASALAGLVGAHFDVKLLGLLGVFVLAAFLSVWIVAFQTYSYEARIAFVGVPALATLAALGVQRWRPPLRFLLPLLCFCGTVVAVQQNVLAVNWSH